MVLSSAERAKKRIEEAKQKAKEGQEKVGKSQEEEGGITGEETGEPTGEGQPVQPEVDEKAAQEVLELLEGELTGTAKNQGKPSAKIAKFINAMEMSNEEIIELKSMGDTTYRIFKTILRQYSSLSEHMSVIKGLNISHVQLMNKVLVNFLRENSATIKEIRKLYMKKSQQDDKLFS